MNEETMKEEEMKGQNKTCIVLTADAITIHQKQDHLETYRPMNMQQDPVYCHKKNKYLVNMK